MKKTNIFRFLQLALFCSVASQSFAGDVLSVRTISLDLASDIASATLKECRKMGYQTSVVVVDRNGILRIAMRDDLAARFTLQIAEDKANAVIMSGVNSGEFRKNRADIRQELNHVDGLLVMTGGVQITAGGNYIGAIGVSGAPGGDIDEACAVKALASFEERLEFAD